MQVSEAIMRKAAAIGTILIFMNLLLLLPANPARAEGREGELLWSYETGSQVFEVSVSADGSFIAAGSDDKKVYFFNREGEL
ncbi:WD40 repeat domain-containing protein, partial [Dehalococcoidia bacterium]|nr:WD40 repeat domain-containing protein [Dehalococcoidia bacterium]